jgi:hypothetical protein
MTGKPHLTHLKRPMRRAVRWQARVHGLADTVVVTLAPDGVMTLRELGRRGGEQTYELDRLYFRSLMGLPYR